MDTYIDRVTTKKYILDTYMIFKSILFNITSIWLKYEILYWFCVSRITGNLLGDISSLREHHDTSLCTDPAIGVEGNSHRVEKRSYLPPVTCTSFHEQNAVRSKVHCQPRPRVIRLPWPNDTSVQTVSHPVYMIREIDKKKS